MCAYHGVQACAHINKSRSGYENKCLKDESVNAEFDVSTSDTMFLCGGCWSFYSEMITRAVDQSLQCAEEYLRMLL